MIITLTPNPSIDHTLELTTLARGEVQRATAAQIDAGGKGVNVATALARNNADVTAVLPCGGAVGSTLLDLLHALNVQVAAVPIGDSVRTNVTIVERDGTTTKINEAGPTLSPDERAALLKMVDERLEGASWLVASGSLPPGCGDDLYADVVQAARRHGVCVALDSSGDALAPGLAAGPTLVKPNHEELEELVGRELTTLHDLVDAANSVQSDGAEEVLISLGAHGALLVSPHGVWYAKGPRVVPRSTVGAGDSLLAGFVHAAASGLTDPGARLRRATAWGTAAVTLPGSTMPRPDDVDESAVVVTAQPELHRPVKEL